MCVSNCLHLAKFSTTIYRMCSLHIIHKTHISSVYPRTVRALLPGLYQHRRRDVPLSDVWTQLSWETSSGEHCEAHRGMACALISGEVIYSNRQLTVSVTFIIVQLKLWDCPMRLVIMRLSIRCVLRLTMRWVMRRTMRLSCLLNVDLLKKSIILRKI
jgi:hypothetical protein